MGQWVARIIEQCNFGPLFCVDLGLSFTAKKADSIKYMYCSKSEVSFSATFETRSKALEWAQSLNALADPMEIMSMSFLNHEQGEVFAESGWIGRSPVALHLWIQK